MGHAKIMYKSGGASSYCFGSEKSAVAGSSLISLVFSSLKMLPPPHAVAKWLVAAGWPVFMGGLPPALYRPICTGPPCRNITKYWRRQNIGARQDFTNFRWGQCCPSSREWQASADSNGRFAHFFSNLKCVKRPLLSEAGFHARLDGQHFFLPSGKHIRAFFFKGRDTLWGYLIFFFFWGGDFFSFSLQHSALLHLPPLRFHCADGCWDRTQDRCNWCIDSQTL
jgi:hypothetical protein